MNLVAVEPGDGFVTITLDRPEALNALSRALRAELAQAILAADADPAVRAIVLTGRGERAFSAGVDLKELSAPDPKVVLEMAADSDPVVALNACTKPVIAAINGVAITGGFELALACDILIASANARFADTHVRVGILPGWGLSQRLGRLVGASRAKELSLTGNFIDAATALQWGLVNRVTLPEALLDEARRLAADIASCDPAAILTYKGMIDDGIDLAIEDALELERQRASAWLKTNPPAEMAKRRDQVIERGRGQ